MGIAKKWSRRRWLGVAALAFATLCAGKAAHDTLARPVVLRTEVALPGLAPELGPLRLLVLSDLHVAGPDMPPARLASIVAQANALEADYVFIAGDFVSDKRTATRSFSIPEAVAPLAKLRPKVGTIAVLGNHDHWRDAAATRSELSKVGVRVLSNQAARVGPLTVGGLDDDFTGHADPAGMTDAMRALGPPFVVVSHSPDPFPTLPRELTLVLAGHTHCGQVRLPLVGALAYMSRYGHRYACGRVDENGRTLVVSAGLGTSILPIRFGTRPDMWLVTVVAPKENEARAAARAPS